MLPEDVREIVTDLLEKARSDQVAWSDGSLMAPTISRNAVAVNLPGATLLFFMSQTGSAHFRMLNDQGQTVLTVGVKSDDIDHEMLLEIIDRGRRKVLRADETISSVRKLLKKQGPVGT